MNSFWRLFSIFSPPLTSGSESCLTSVCGCGCESLTLTARRKKSLCLSVASTLDPRLTLGLCFGYEEEERVYAIADPMSGVFPSWGKGRPASECEANERRLSLVCVCVCLQGSRRPDPLSDSFSFSPSAGASCDLWLTTRGLGEEREVLDSRVIDLDDKSGERRGDRFSVTAAPMLSLS